MKILGLMSGTSFDGVDAAILEFNGNSFSFGDSHFQAYHEEERKILRSALGTWQATPEVLDAIHAAHNRAIAKFDDFDVIGFHGQTLNHDPQSGRTFQAGDPAKLLGNCPVVYDFRSQDVQSGGQGAPLIPIYHYALAQMLGFEKPVGFVNIGGVANVTYVDPKEPPARLVAFDCGIGNALGDDLVFRKRGLNFDEDGAIAQRGEVHHEKLQKLLSHPYFERPAPKSLDRLEFHLMSEMLNDLSLEDALATINAFTAEGILRAQAHFPKSVERWIICGGGRKNQAIMQYLGANPIEDFGLDGDMIEAQGFAYLAWCKLKDKPISFPMTTGVPRAMMGGEILWRR